jgi:hypothetical protein
VAHLCVLCKGGDNRFKHHILLNIMMAGGPAIILRLCRDNLGCLMPRAPCDGWEAGAQVIFSLLLLFYHPQLAESGLQFRDLLVMDVAET